MKNRFSPEKYFDRKIVNETGEVIGHVRLKPNSVLWAPKNAKEWYGIELDDFARFMEREGRRQKK